MNIKTHTKGRWFAVGAHVEHISDDIADICSCNPSDYSQGHLNRSYDEICANALLISCAPAMLQAIKNLLKFIPDDPENDDIRHETINLIRLATGKN